MTQHYWRQNYLDIDVGIDISVLNMENNFFYFILCMFFRPTYKESISKVQKRCNKWPWRITPPGKIEIQIKLVHNFVLSSNRPVPVPEEMKEEKETFSFNIDLKEGEGGEEFNWQQMVDSFIRVSKKR